MAGFFDSYPRFFETSSVGAWPERLNLRHHAIFYTNRDLFLNARVLDMASHDGRWSLAALKCGAAFVRGIEVRQKFVDSAKENFRHYGIEDKRYEFVLGDIGNLQSSDENYDIVLCLGFFYHTLNHLNLFRYIQSTKAKYIILDGMVDPDPGPIIRVFAESVSQEANGVSDEGVFRGNILVGHPSISALKLLMTHYGYRSQIFDWSKLIKESNTVVNLDKTHGDGNPIADYARGTRATLVGERTI